MDNFQTGIFVYMRYFLFIFLILFSISCSPRIKKKAELPFDAVEVSSNGGFTGTSTGFSIHKTGEIFLLYHLPGKPYNQKYHRQTTPDSVNIVFNKVLSSGIQNSNHQQPGNMTYTITLRKDSSIHSVYWADGQDSTESFKELYRYLRSFANGKNQD